LALGIAAVLALTLVLGVTLASATAPVVSNVEAPAGEVAFTTAKAKGEVSPEGKETTCHFEFVTDEQFTNEGNSFAAAEPNGQTAPCNIEPLTGSGLQTVEAQLGGLHPKTAYHLRLLASNEDGQSEGVAASTFETEEVTPPVVSGVQALEVEYTRAKLKGEVEIANADEAFKASNCRFEYLTQAEWEADSNEFPEPEGAPSIGCGAEPTGPGTTTVEAELTGLQQHTTYHLRLVAVNQGGTGKAEASNFSTLEVTPPSVEGLEVTAITGEEAEFEGEVDTNSPEAAPASEGIEEAFGANWSFSPGSSSGHAPADDEGEVVNGAAKGLEPNTEYTATLMSTNAGGTDEESVAFETEEVPPTVLGGTNTPEGLGKTLVRAYVTPRNSAVTDCHFEYGLTESYGQSLPCEGVPGSGAKPVEVTIDPAGLKAGATYHFKVVATNGAGTGESEDAPFASLAEEEEDQACANAGKPGVGVLPECRAWEMVSPPDKNGGDLIQSPSLIRIATDGSAATFNTLLGFGDTIGGGIVTTYLSERTDAANPGDQGWSTHSVTPAQPPSTWANILTGTVPQYEGSFSPDLTKAVFKAHTPLTEAPNVAGLANLYLRNDLRNAGAGHYSLVTDCPLCALSDPDTPIGPQFFAAFRPFYVDATPDFGHILFETKANLAPGASGFDTKLYESDHGTVRLAGILPDSACGSPPCAASSSFAGMGFTQLGAVTSHAISEDGSKIFFTTQSSGGGNLYMRLDASSTVQLNESERGEPDPSGPQPARFWDASVSGSRVFFTSNEALTDDAPLGGNKLYMYDTTKPPENPHNLSFLSPDNQSADSPGDVVSWVIGASADGSSVYFVANGQLVAGGPISSNDKMFRWHDGALSFVSDVSGNDGVGLSRSALPAIGGQSARVSRDGDLLFGPHLPVGPTGYAQGKCERSVDDVCGQYYLYEGSTQQLNCVSCDPRGGPGTAEAELMPIVGAGGSGAATHLNNALFDEGRYAGFTTAERLLPGDTNGEADAYVYDSQTGRLHLLSSGLDKFPSYFMEASPSGRDVFLMTREALSRWDVDSAYDLYDARVGGGFPEPPPTPVSCQGDACQPTPNQLNDPTPSSSTFVGADSHARAKKHHRKKRHHRARKHHARTAQHNRRTSR
jgi:hypothetical protein